ncbi:MAG: F0F1 ATP synthase subunit B [Propionibacteriales bacterium]|nr:F0F1 ATP synthase subunit B [Propionibacteriales bacterium]
MTNIAEAVYLIPLAAAEEESGGDNPLLPNATFIVELLAFALILFVLAKWILPPINRAMVERQQKIHRQFEESEQAKARAEEAERQFRQQMIEARHEAARIREEAREQGAAIVSEMREQAQAEARRIVETGHVQLQAERQQVLQQLRNEVGGMASTLAARIVGESLADDERQRRTVDRFISELESQDTTAGAMGQVR